jgi:hypothetical protein
MQLFSVRSSEAIRRQTVTGIVGFTDGRNADKGRGNRKMYRGCRRVGSGKRVGASHNHAAVMRWKFGHRRLDISFVGHVMLCWLRSVLYPAEVEFVPRYERINRVWVSQQENFHTANKSSPLVLPCLHRAATSCRTDSSYASGAV